MCGNSAGSSLGGLEWSSAANVADLSDLELTKQALDASDETILTGRFHSRPAARCTSNI